MLQWVSLTTISISSIKKYNFTDERITVLSKIKNLFASYIASKRNIEVNDIFGDPMYKRLVGLFKRVDQLFDG